jgi:hypothetical protein
MAIEIRGKIREWIFLVQEDPKYLPEWQADGLHITEVENVIPQWYVDLGLSVRLWVFLQDRGLI